MRWIRSSRRTAWAVFLAASQRTKRIRLGHGIVQLPPGFHHPAREAMPCFAKNEVAREKAKLERLAEASGNALQRGTPRASCSPVM
jgi:hypothetical protein